MRTQNILKSLAIGAASGTIATFPMTAMMELLRYVLLDYKPETFPPRQVALGIMKKSGLDKPLRAYGEPAVLGITAITHLGFGGVSGAIYGALASLFPRRKPTPLNAAAAAAHGATFGILVWSGSYFGWLPALGIVKPQGDYPVEKNTILVLSHIVWGATTGLIFHHQIQKMNNRPPTRAVARKARAHRPGPKRRTRAATTK